MTKVCIFGCKSTTRHLIEHLSDFLQIDGLVTISPTKGKNQDVAGYDDMRDISSKIPNFYTANKYNLKGKGDLDFFLGEKFDVGFVAGWQRLVPSKILDTFKHGVFGMHGSSQNLPFGRGRSPMNWSLIERREWFHTNLFQYVPGVDDGPIVDTVMFSINGTDTAETLHYKNLSSMVSLVRKNWPDMAANNITTQPQPNLPPTYYPKRTPADGIINWVDVIQNIESHIRAVGYPFSGAFSFIGHNKVTFDRAAIFYTDLEQHPYLKLPYGTVCDVFPNNKFIVRCNGGVLIIHKYSLENEQIIRRNMQFTSPVQKVKQFKRNSIGYFDLLDTPDQ